jgi:hypothetical protein
MMPFLALLVVGLLLVVAYGLDQRKKRVIADRLRQLHLRYSGRLIKGNLFLYPKLIMMYRGVEMTLSAMSASGGEMTSRASTLYLWFRWDRFVPYEFQIEDKRQHRIGINPRPKVISGDARFDSLFDVYATPAAHKQVVKLLVSGLAMILVAYVEHGGSVRTNCVRGSCVLSIPLIPDGIHCGVSLVELGKDWIDLLMDAEMGELK